MPQSPTPTQLASVISQLQTDRQKHEDAIAEIDDLFGQYGIKTTKRKRRGRPRGPGRPKRSVSKKKAKKKVGKKRGRKKGVKKVGKKKGRRKFSKTAEQFLLDLLKGRKTLTTAEINAKWNQAKRGGTADNTLMKLVNDKKLKRESIKGERGSKYTLAKSKSKKNVTKKKSVKKSAAKKTSKKKSSKKKAATKGTVYDV